MLGEVTMVLIGGAVQRKGDEEKRGEEEMVGCGLKEEI